MTQHNEIRSLRLTVLALMMASTLTMVGWAKVHDGGAQSDADAAIGFTQESDSSWAPQYARGCRPCVSVGPSYGGASLGGHSGYGRLLDDEYDF